jgi:hypothetical protein
MAPASTAMPQYFNPYLEEIKRKEDEDIKISLNHK